MPGGECLLVAAAEGDAATAGVVDVTALHAVVRTGISLPGGVVINMILIAAHFAGDGLSDVVIHGRSGVDQPGALSHKDSGGAGVSDGATGYDHPMAAFHVHANATSHFDRGTLKTQMAGTFQGDDGCFEDGYLHDRLAQIRGWPEVEDAFFIIHIPFARTVEFREYIDGNIFLEVATAAHSVQMRHGKFHLAFDRIDRCDGVVIVSESVVQGALYPDIRQSRPALMSRVGVGEGRAPVRFIAGAWHGARI